jgi:hypothetical protein
MIYRAKSRAADACHESRLLPLKNPVRPHGKVGETIFVGNQ